MPVKRPAYSKEKNSIVFMAEWAYECAKLIELQQVGKDFIANGGSLEEYEIRVHPARVDVLIADYLKFSVKGRGRRPGGGRWSIKAAAQWIVDKAIMSSDDKGLNTFAYFLSKKQQKEGNAVFRGEREGIVIEDAVNESFNAIADEQATIFAQGAADRLIKNIQL